LKALSEPARLRIVSLLTWRSLCVSDLQLLLNASQPYVSRHLAFLHGAGLVFRTRRNGVDLYYLNLMDVVIHPYVTLVIELQLTRPTLKADRDKLEQLKAQGVLRADRSGIEIEKPLGSAQAENGIELAATISRAAGSLSEGGVL
jgi:DNA-binding transcriptional ArsR family regulator